MNNFRNRYNDEGQVIRAIALPFMEIPDDFTVQSITHHPHLSMPYVLKMLNKQGIPEFQDNYLYAKCMLEQLAIEYLKAADTLIHNTKIQPDLVPYEIIPALFLCKHALELKIKQCLLHIGDTNISGHSVMNLWTRLQQLSNTPITNESLLTTFVHEMHNLDNNEMALRYGVQSALKPLQENFTANVYTVLNNTKYLFNVLQEDVLTFQPATDGGKPC